MLIRSDVVRTRIAVGGGGEAERHRNPGCARLRLRVARQNSPTAIIHRYGPRGRDDRRTVAPPASGSEFGAGRRPRAGGWGNRVSPSPHPVGGFGRAEPSQEHPMVIPSGCGGAAWTANVNIGRWSRGMGKPGFPIPPGGRVGESGALPGTPYVHRVGVRRSRMDGW